MALASLRDYKPREFKPNFSFFDDFLKDHRQHQISAGFLASKVKHGQIISPCGTGKTRIQISLHVDDMIDQFNAHEFGVNLIVSHRLGLNRQLRDELVDIAIRCGLSFDILSIESARSDTSKYYAKYAGLGYSPSVSRHLTSLNQKEIETFIASATQEYGRPVLIVSTYNSIGRLQNAGEIRIATFDEAHNIVREDFTDNIKQVKDNILRSYYFTATRRIKDNNGGMDDEELFGPIIYNFKPQEALELGEIACPRIHIVRGHNNELTNSFNTAMLVKNTIEAFSIHRRIIKEDSIHPDDIGAKIIVGANGIEEMEDVYFDTSLVKAFQGKACLAISSKCAYVNHSKVSDAELFSKMLSLKDSEDAIIFNVDMLSEGINLPSITGVMPLRNLGRIKLFQLFGRPLRLLSKDRVRLYSGELKPGDYKNYIKPYGHLIIPEHLKTISEHETMKEYIIDIYSAYGIPIEKLVIQDKYNPNPDDLKSVIPRETSDGKLFNLEHDIVDIVSSVKKQKRDAELAKKNSLQDKIDYLLSL